MREEQRKSRECETRRTVYGVSHLRREASANLDGSLQIQLQRLAV